MRTSMSLIQDNIMYVSAVQATLPKTGKGAHGEEVTLQFNDDEVCMALVLSPTPKSTSSSPMSPKTKGQNLIVLVHDTYPILLPSSLFSEFLY